MKKLEIKNDIFWIGAVDHDLRVFDIIMYTEFGTSYNSYLVKGSEKVALIETVKHTFTESYIEKLEEEINPETIDYIVLDHTEPDHAGTVAKLLSKAKNATVLASEAAVDFLKEIANIEFKYQIVKQDDEISLGNKTLRFIDAPFLHWPDSIYTYVVEDKVLFTCDSFGAHYATDDILLSKITNQDDYQKAMKYYYDMIIGPFNEYLLNAIDKIEDLEIDVIGTGHGPVIDTKVNETIEQWKAFATIEQPKEKTIVIPYVSAYGYTRKLAEKIEEGIEEVGGLTVKIYDMVYEEQAEVLKEIYFAKGVLFGTPTINGDALYPIMDMLIKLSPVVHSGKFASAFGSYGWSGEGVGNVLGRLNDLRMKTVEGYKIRFRPNPDERIGAFNFGKEFAETVLGKREYIPYEDEYEEFVDEETGATMWRCLVCGEVFEGNRPPKICPVCGASAEQFEPYEEDAVEYSSDYNGRIVIIGNGAGGLATIESIRKRNSKAKITLIDRDTLYAYYRPLLSEYIENDETMSQLFLHDKTWYDEHNVQLLLGENVIQIDKAASEVVLENGSKIPYDKLILACGSKCFVPPIKNALVTGVYNLRNMKDANRIKERAADSKNAVIIGGGLLGLEVANSLNKMNIDTSVIEISDRALPRQADENASAMIEDVIKENGIKFIKNSGVKEILGEDEVTGVIVNSGEELPADIVIISAGVRANTKLASDIGIKVNRGIVVDKFMRTNVENIYAVGDAAEFEGINYAIWEEALDQGKVAGANAVGDLLEYHNFIPSTAYNGMGISVFSIGVVNPIDDENVSELVYEDKCNCVYKKLIFLDQKLSGAIVIGDNGCTKALIDGVNHGKSQKSMLKVFH